MKGKIDRHGQLWIVRAGEWVLQRCKPSGDLTCRHDCPRFGEPEAETTPSMVDYDGKPESVECPNPYKGKMIASIPTGRTRLRLCHGTVLTFDEFTDERSAE